MHRNGGEERYRDRFLRPKTNRISTEMIKVRGDMFTRIDGLLESWKGGIQFYTVKSLNNDWKIISRNILFVVQIVDSD